MVRFTGSQYDLVTVKQVQALSARLDAIAFEAGTELERVSRSVSDRVTSLDETWAQIHETAIKDQHDIQRALANVIARVRALEVAQAHPWRNRWARVRALLARQIRRD